MKTEMTTQKQNKTNRKFNALPPTMLMLDEKFGASFSLSGARDIAYIEANGYTTFEKGKRPKPNHWVDIYVRKSNGDTHTIRSVRTNLTAKQARDLHRNITRKIAVFLFENKEVNKENKHE